MSHRFIIAEVHDPFLPVRVFDHLISNSLATRRQYVDHSLSSNNDSETVGCVVTGLKCVAEEKAMARGFSKLFVKPRAEDEYVTRSPLDRRRQFQNFAVTEDGYDERVSGFERSDAVVNLFVVFVAR